MPFTSKNNKITVKGYLSSDLLPTENDYAITFKIKVARPAEAGKRPFYDEFSVYVADRQNVSNCRANLTQGMSVSVTGELRVWYDKTYKICANKITPIW